MAGAGVGLGSPCREEGSHMRADVLEVLDKFDRLVSTRDMSAVDEFTDDALLVGSEAGEIAKGRRQLEAFFVRVFAREDAFSWVWDRVEVSDVGDVAWFLAEGHVVIGSHAAPYRVSGVLRRVGGRWLWSQYHGSEPVQ